LDNSSLYTRRLERKKEGGKKEKKKKKKEKEKKAKTRAREHIELSLMHPFPSAR
jgi:hypothetical protein